MELVISIRERKTSTPGHDEYVESLQVAVHYSVKYLGGYRDTAQKLGSDQLFPYYRLCATPLSPLKAQECNFQFQWPLKSIISAESA